jgi:threonine aldolase
VETNIVGLDLSQLPLSASEFAQMVKNEGVLISSLGPKFARVVTHLNIDDAAMKYAAEVLASTLQRALVSQ